MSSYKIDFTIVSKHEALSFYFLCQMKKHLYVFDILSSYGRLSAIFLSCFRMPCWTILISIFSQFVVVNDQLFLLPILHHLPYS